MYYFFSPNVFSNSFQHFRGGVIIEQECPLDSLTDLLCYESYCIPSGRLPRVINCAFDQSFYAKSENAYLLLVYSFSPKVQKYLLGFLDLRSQ